MKIAKTTTFLAVAALAGGPVASVNAADYLIGTKGNSQDLAAKVDLAGGTLTRSYPFGLAVASSSDPEFKAKLGKAVKAQFIVEDIGFETAPVAPQIVADFGFPPNSGDDDAFFDLQWGHNYVGATNAWNNGYRGQNVTVAVLDGGFDLDHPDLAPNIVDVADMTGQGAGYACADVFSHGTHTAGTVAAADNSFGTIGVAPEAGLMLVKVLEDVVPEDGPPCTGSGSFADVIAGIYYAAVHGAHVINMSLGASIPRIGSGADNAAISALQNAVNKAITFAHQGGTTVIVSAGNDAEDLDGGNRSAVRFNTGMSHAVGISAVAPQNWAGTGNTAPLFPASYTNYGTSMVDFSAPGGDVAYPGNEGCVVAGLARPCWVFDLVFSTGNGGWYWSGGTSMASPHAAGVAALIISETGNSDPAHVIRELRQRALDSGKPGRDDYFGHGIVNSGN